MQMLGHTVEFVSEVDPFDSLWRIHRYLEWHLCTGPITLKWNRLFFKRAVEFKPDIVWVEMGRHVYASTLERIKEVSSCLLINTYSDDFLDSSKISRHYEKSIPIYDYIFTPRQVNFPELYSRGAKKVGKFWKGFAPERVFPENLSNEEKRFYGTDVVFVGHYESDRAGQLAHLCKAIRNVKIWGIGWQRCREVKFPQGVVQYRSTELEHEYRKALCGSKIAIHFLSRWARDTQSSRSFEIPACRVMMLAERSDDHLACFEENKEAVFFSSTEELVDKAQFYLSYDESRQKIAQAGYQRCISSGYSNYARVSAMIDEALKFYADKIISEK